MSTVGDDIKKNSLKAKQAIVDAKIGDKISSFWGKVTGKNKKKAEATAEVEDLEQSKDVTGEQPLNDPSQSKLE
jgi:hypothetical protein